MKKFLDVMGDWIENTTGSCILAILAKVIVFFSIFGIPITLGTAIFGLDVAATIFTVYLCITIFACFVVLLCAITPDSHYTNYRDYREIRRSNIPPPGSAGEGRKHIPSNISDHDQPWINVPFDFVPQYGRNGLLMNGEEYFVIPPNTNSSTETFANINSSTATFASPNRSNITIHGRSGYGGLGGRSGFSRGVSGCINETRCYGYEEDYYEFVTYDDNGPEVVVKSEGDEKRGRSGYAIQGGVIERISARPNFHYSTYKQSGTVPGFKSKKEDDNK